MQSVSQKVVIDSIKKTTLLDKKATIAQGNISKQRDTLQVLYYDSMLLIDSLHQEINLYKIQSRTLHDSVIIPLKILSAEKTTELNHFSEKYKIRENYFKAEIKSQKSKKWTWLGVGGAAGIILTLLLSGN